MKNKLRGDYVRTNRGPETITQATRSLLFPDSRLTYSGTTGFRILFPVERLQGLEVPDATVFFHGPKSSVFTTEVGRGLLEISTRAPFASVDKLPWGQDISKAEVLSHYTVRDQALRFTCFRLTRTALRTFTRVFELSWKPPRRGGRSLLTLGPRASRPSSRAARLPSLAMPPTHSQELSVCCISKNCFHGC